MQNILVPFDGSKHALKALHIACDLVDKYKGEIFVLEVLPQPESHKSRQPIADHLELARSKLVGRGIEAFHLEREKGRPVQAILLAAKRHKISLIVMGCRGVKIEMTSKTQLGSRTQFGSVSQDVFKEASCTCIAVK